MDFDFTEEQEDFRKAVREFAEEVIAPRAEEFNRTEEFPLDIVKEMRAAFAKVKSFGKAAYPKLIAYIDHEQPEFAIAAVAVLNALTGRDSALPKGVTKSKIKAEWEEWLKSADAAPKPDAPKQP